MQTFPTAAEVAEDRGDAAQPVEKCINKAGFELLATWKERYEDNTCQRGGKAKPRPH